jgi:hypothetical protein
MPEESTAIHEPETSDSARMMPIIANMERFLFLRTEMTEYLENERNPSARTSLLPLDEAPAINILPAR